MRDELVARSGRGSPRCSTRMDTNLTVIWFVDGLIISRVEFYLIVIEEYAWSLGVRWRTKWRYQLSDR
jgi:hypothetical protein